MRLVALLSCWLLLTGCVDRAALSQRCNEQHPCPDNAACVDVACWTAAGDRVDSGVITPLDAGPDEDVDAGDDEAPLDAGGDGGPDAGCPASITAYADDDGDGVGSGEPLEGCFLAPLGPGLAEGNGDCEPADDSRWQERTIYPDLDGDGYTGPAETACLGDVPSDDGLNDARQIDAGAGDGGSSGSPRLTPALVPAVVSSPRSIVGWENVDTGDLDAADDALIEWDADDDATYSPPVVITGFASSRTVDSEVLGVRLRVVRRAQDSSPLRHIIDDAVQLVVAGVVTGANHATTMPWGEAPEEVSYGGPSDTWGATLTAADVQSADFGISIRVQNVGNDNTRAYIDSVVLEVYLAESPSDCDDGDEAAWLYYDGAQLDQDGDGYGAGAVDPPLCAGFPAPPSYVLSSLGDDCYDDNDDAWPGTTSYYGVHRGDGSFDYNCDASTTKQSESQATGCSCSVTGTCSGSYDSYTPSASCGSSTSDDYCSGACPSSCSLAQGSSTVRCR